MYVHIATSVLVNLVTTTHYCHSLTYPLFFPAHYCVATCSAGDLRYPAPLSTKEERTDPIRICFCCLSQLVRIMYYNPLGFSLNDLLRKKRISSLLMQVWHLLEKEEALGNSLFLQVLTCGSEHISLNELAFVITLFASIPLKENPEYNVNCTDKMHL